MLIPLTAIKNPTTTRKKISALSSLKTKMDIPSMTTRGRDCMLRSVASGTKTSIQIVLPITGRLRVLLFAINSGMKSKQSILFYVVVLGGGKSRRCGKRITTAGRQLSWLGNLRRDHVSVPATRTTVASASERSLRNPRIPMARPMNCLTHLDRRRRRRERPQFLG